MTPSPRIAFVHDWLTTWGGSELVLRSLLEIWPGTPVHTLLADPRGQCRELIAGNRIVESFIARLPRARSAYRSYLPLMPLAVEQFDLSGYDLVISNSHAVAKGVLTGPDQLHVSYVQTPIRYAWDLQHEYLRQAGLARGPRSLPARLLLHYIRLWDLRTANGVDEFVANSRFIARRIAKTYRRAATVIHPPVEVERCAVGTDKQDFYLAVSRLVPYKRMDLIVEAFSHMPGRRLVVVGDGPERRKLQSGAAENVTFTGYLPFEVLKDHLQRARAFVFAAEEDFGILPVEALACGTPVIAYGRGGVLETVVSGHSGLFFDEQTPAALAAAVDEFEARPAGFQPQELRRQAERFGKARFQQEFKTFVDEKWEAFLRDTR